MRRIRVWAELPEWHYRAYEGEARRAGVEVEELVERTVNCLLRELEREETSGCGPDQAVAMS